MKSNRRTAGLALGEILRAHGWVLTGIFVVAMSLRAIAVYQIGDLEGPRPGSDMHEFDRNGWNLAAGNGLRGPSPANGEEDRPTAFRPPGYAVLLAACYTVFGHRYDVPLLVNAFLGSLTAVMIGIVGVRLFSQVTGCVAGALYAINPVTVYSAASLLSESLFTLCLFLLVVTVAFLQEAPWRQRFWCLMGGMSGVAALVRPEALFVLPLLVLWLVWHERGSLRARALLAAVLLATFCAVLTPWSIRNALALGRFIPLSTGAGTAFLGGNNRMVVEVEGLRGYWVYDGNIPEYQGRFAGMDEYERNQASMKAGLEYLRAHLAVIPSMMAWKMERYWSPFIKAESRMLRLLMLVSWGPVLLLFLLGCFLFLRQAGAWGDPRGFLLLLLLYHVPLVTIFYGSVRLRSAVEPICVTFAGYSVARVLKWWQERRSPAE